MTPSQRDALRIICELGARTAVEIDVESGWRDAHKRVTELADEGYIKCIGSRKSYGSRIASRVWTLTRKGERALR